MSDIMKTLKSNLLNKTFLLSTATFIAVSLILAGIFAYQASGNGIDKNRIMKYADANAMAKSLESKQQREAAGASIVSDTVDTINKHVDENSEDTTTVTLDKYDMVNVTFKLSWTDEKPSKARYTNQPDKLGISVTPPTGETKSVPPAPNDANGQGSAEVSFTIKSEDMEKMKGDWKVTVEAGDCGDQEPMFSLLQLRAIADTGNDYTVEVIVDHYTE